MATTKLAVDIYCQNTVAYYIDIQDRHITFHSSILIEEPNTTEVIAFRPNPLERRRKFSQTNRSDSELCFLVKLFSNLLEETIFFLYQ